MKLFHVQNRPDPMRPARWALFIVCLAAVAFFILAHFGSNGRISNVHAALIRTVQTPTASSPTFRSREPRYITVRMKTPIKTLTAGETGSFELEAELKVSEDVSGPPPSWNRDAGAPLVIWVASPDTSGISFIDRVHPERPRQHILVKFTAPPAPGSQVLTETMEYSVNARTKAGNHAFWMDINGELIDGGGQKFQDVGVGQLPFEKEFHMPGKSGWALACFLVALF